MSAYVPVVLVKASEVSPMRTDASARIASAAASCTCVRRERHIATRV